MQEYDYPIGGPCGWMWARKKESSLAQDNNPNHLPAGSPDSTGGRFAKKENSVGGQPVSKDDKAYLKDAIYPADDLLNFLPLSSTSTLSLKTLSVLKVLPSLSKETIAWLEKHFAKEEAEKALAGAPKNVLKEEKALSNFLEKKGAPQKAHINKYAEKSKANANTTLEKAKVEREALSKIDLRLPKPSKELFEGYEKEGHLLERHMIEGNAHNPTGMRDVHLIKRAQTEKSASAIHNMETLMESYGKALKNPKNQAELRRLLAGEEEKVWLKVDMKRNIGRYVKKGSYVPKDAKKVEFLVKRTKNNPEGFYIETLELRP